MNQQSICFIQSLNKTNFHQEVCIQWATESYKPKMWPVKGCIVQWILGVEDKASHEHDHLFHPVEQT